LLPWLPAAAQPLSRSGEVVVVYNQSLPESKAVAEHYARARNLGSDRLLGFALSTNEVIDRAEFRRTLEEPLREELIQRGLLRFAPRTQPATTNSPAIEYQHPVAAAFRYLVLCYGVPVQVTHDPTIAESYGEKLNPTLRTTHAAVDAELALLTRDKKLYPLTGPIPNPFLRLTNSAFLHPTNGLTMVTRLDGPSATLAMGLVDKALVAEQNGLWGRAYFDTRNITDTNNTYHLGDLWIRAAMEVTRRVGFETVWDNEPDTMPAGFPVSHVALYAGWYATDANGPWGRTNVEFMPGAFAYHLHSYSANIVRSPDKFWVGPLLARGATATMGCVTEPYLGLTPNVGIFLEGWLLRAMTFGEAAYACQPGLSWQTTVIGDPLYRPFGQRADVLHQKLEQQNSPLVEWSILRSINQNMIMGEPAAKFVQLLETYPPAKRSSILLEKLADLYNAAGKVTAAADTYERILKMSLTPQQRKRIALNAAKPIDISGRPAEALRLLDEVLKNDPGYEPKLALYQQMLPLAEKARHAGDIERIKLEIVRLTPPPPAATNSPATNAKPNP
jgi:uncharacterized protein (TIGR03790 family)